MSATRESARLQLYCRPYHGAVTSTVTAARTYQVRTYGCQMNVHDSERLAGLLEAAGYRRAADGADADVVVFNTCAVRENADNKLYGNLSHLAPRKQADPNMQIAVGGCLAQKDRDAVLHRAPWVDVVFGTHNIGSLPTLLDRARHNRAAQVEIVEALQEFPSNLPAARESAYAGWVSISVGCNNTCTFCIVPALRGKEVDRRPGDVLAEVQSLVDQGVLEVTLLGQNVNAYGVSFADPDRPRDRGAFAQLLRACGRIDGLERVRFTSPHPAEFTDDVIEAMAQTPNVCPALHMPHAVRVRPGAAGHAPLISLRALPVDPREGARGHPARRHHHRLDRRFPRRDRAGLPRDARRGRRGAVQRRVHVPVLEATGHAGRRARRTAAESRCAGTLSTTDRPAGTDLAGGEHRSDRSHGRTARGRRGRAQGHPHRQDVRTRTRRQAGALHAGGCRHPARRHRHHHRHRRSAAPPDRRRSGAPPPAHPCRRRARGGRAVHRVSGSACPASACLRTSRPHPDVRGDRGRQPQRRLRRVQGRHRGRRTPRRAGDRSRRKGIGASPSPCSCCC